MTTTLHMTNGRLSQFNEGWAWFKKFNLILGDLIFFTIHLTQIYSFPLKFKN